MKLINQKSISIFVFLGIIIVIAIITAISVPYISKQITEIFLSIQTDVNKRQAQNIAGYINTKFKAGEDMNKVLQDVSILLSNTDSNLGYSCVIESETGNYLYFPDQSLIGKNVSVKNALYTAIDYEINDEPFQDFVANRKEGEGTLFYPQMENNYREAIAVTNVPGVNWKVSTHENIAKIRAAIDGLSKNIIIISIVIALIIAIASTLVSRRISFIYERQIQDERDKNEQLLRRTLPDNVVDTINEKGSFLPRRYDQSTVLFADLSGFTSMCAKADPQVIVQLLNEVFNRFDKVIKNYSIEKIKTIGDAYMVCSGAPIPHPQHANHVMKFAIEIIKELEEFNKQYKLSLKLRIGINSGEVVGGVIGQTRYAFDIWGDTVNVANRMESTGVAGSIQVSESTYQELKNEFNFNYRGEIEVKGKGFLKAYIYSEDEKVANSEEKENTNNI